MKKGFLLLLLFVLPLLYVQCRDDTNDTTVKGSSPSYSVSFTYNSTAYNFTKSFNEITGANACASNDTLVTNIYALETAIAFADAGSPTDALYITDISLLASGTAAGTATIYNSGGVMSVSETVTVIITSYGNEGNTVTGTFEGTQITSGSFTVYNSGTE